MADKWEREALCRKDADDNTKVNESLNTNKQCKTTCDKCAEEIRSIKGDQRSSPDENSKEDDNDDCS